MAVATFSSPGRLDQWYKLMSSPHNHERFSIIQDWTRQLAIEIIKTSHSCMHETPKIRAHEVLPKYGKDCCQIENAPPYGTRGCNWLEVRKHALYTSNPRFINRAILGWWLQCWEGEAGRVAPIEHENGGEMNHFMALKTKEKVRRRKRKTH